MKKLLALTLAAALSLSLCTTAFASSYTVERGDSLWSIARKELGKGSRWGEIYKANQSIIKNPSLIYIGQVLNIPDGDTQTATENDEESKAMENTVSISNSYDNTEELLRKFPVTNPTPIETKLARDIQNRLLNGFENWNRGYDAWEAWGDILYTADSIYNVHDVRLTLKEYQDIMNVTLKANNMQMGNFENIIVCDDWTAIRYNILGTDRQTGVAEPGCVMEFVNFKDYGEGLGTRVVEGWAGVKGPDFDFFSSVQTDEERAAQQKAMDDIVNSVIPDTDNLEEKYPVVHPTTSKGDIAEKIKQAILTDFDEWNQGYDTWAEWADTYYDEDLRYCAYITMRDLDEVKAAVRAAAETTDVQRLRFNNMLISGDWAAIYYTVVETDKATGEKSMGSRMEFLHFAEFGDSVKVTECWTMEQY